MIKLYNLDLLKKCQHYDDIEGVLDEMGVENTIHARTSILCYYMDLEWYRGCSGNPEGLSEEDNYSFLKDNLIVFNSQA